MNNASEEIIQNGICFIMGAGEYGERIPHPAGGDLLIAADGGYAVCRDRGLTPDLVLGDFDSLGYRPEDRPVISLPVVKDDTDMRAAVREGWQRGYRRFSLYGGAGGRRTSHTIANIQLLAEIADRGGQGEMIGAASRFTVIRNSTFVFGADAAGDLSVFSLSDRSEGVNIRGARYELTDAVLDNLFPLGVSNSFIGQSGEVSVHRGTLLILEEFPV